MWRRRTAAGTEAGSAAAELTPLHPRAPGDAHTHTHTRTHRYAEIAPLVNAHYHPEGAYSLALDAGIDGATGASRWVVLVMH